ncbi:MAG: translocation/assembly module TamB domain-containing protein, partial [Limisphaerales bacterium]
GYFDIVAQNINSSWVEEFLPEDLPELDLNLLQLRGSWSNGPVQFIARSNVRFTHEQTNTFVLRFDAASDPQGVVVEHLDLLTEVGPVLSGTGRVPLQILPGRPDGLVRVDWNAPINFRAESVPNPEVWQQVAALTDIHLVDPHLHVVVSGSLEDPTGTVQMRAQQADWQGTNAQRFPPLQNLRADIDLSEERVRLHELRFLVENQPVTVTAQLPIGPDFSERWQDVFDWKRASGRIVVPQAQLAAFTKYFPEILAPQGMLNADISFSPGPNFDGYLTIDRAATRPLPDSGPFQDIFARLRMVQQRIEFENVHALLGGQPVGFFGHIDFATNRPGNLPAINLFVQGENVPLARRTDLILRSDLNIRISNLTNDIPVISGTARLRDSVFLGDLRMLIPGRVARPERRPPYFAVEQEPFANWLLDLTVHGENFLRARSPIFRGTVSAGFRIRGPLREPIALGDVRAETGMIMFPFANFQVQQGFVTLSSEDPFRPELLITGTSRAYGYELEMSITGPADGPIIEFSSTPPLTSEQIILMVTAGEVPRQGFGFTGQQRAQRLALFLGRSVLGRLTDGAGAERLSITTGEEISEQGRETYALQYRINENWSIVGEYDRFGALNFGLKWRIFSR